MRRRDWIGPRSAVSGRRVPARRRACSRPRLDGGEGAHARSGDLLFVPGAFVDARARAPRRRAAELAPSAQAHWAGASPRLACPRPPSSSRARPRPLPPPAGRRGSTRATTSAPSPSTEPIGPGSSTRKIKDGGGTRESRHGGDTRGRAQPGRSVSAACAARARCQASRVRDDTRCRTELRQISGGRAVRRAPRCSCASMRRQSNCCRPGCAWDAHPRPACRTQQISIRPASPAGPTTCTSAEPPRRPHRPERAPACARLSRSRTPGARRLHRLQLVERPGHPRGDGLHDQPDRAACSTATRDAIAPRSDCVAGRFAFLNRDPGRCRA